MEGGDEVLILHRGEEDGSECVERLGLQAVGRVGSQSELEQAAGHTASDHSALVGATWAPDQHANQTEDEPGVVKLLLGPKLQSKVVGRLSIECEGRREAENRRDRRDERQLFEIVLTGCQRLVESCLWGTKLT